MIPAFLSLLWAQVPSCWNNITPLLLTLLLLALLLDYVMFRKTNGHFPPGPAPLPFLGNSMHAHLLWNPLTTVQQMAEKYGPVFSFQLGWKKFVVLNGFKIVTKALRQNDEALSDRPYLPLFSLAGYTKQSEGRHACPGEQMAKTELFIFFTSLLQRFTFCIPENHPRTKEDRLFALTVSPHPFQICAIPR